jgi:hypothetical protein
MKTIINLNKNYNLRLNLISYNLIFYINIILPSLILKIRTIYSLIIIMFVLLNVILKISLTLGNFDIFTSFSDLLALSSNFDSDNFNFEGSSSNNSSNQFGSNQPNSSFNTDSGTALAQSTNQDNYNYQTNNLNNSNFNTNETDLESSLEEYFRDIKFNEVQYESQFDDETFNPVVLYPFDHPFYNKMIEHHVINDSINDVLDAIRKTDDELGWNASTRFKAISSLQQTIKSYSR